MIFIGWDIGMLEGQYANYVKILHNAFEFVLDFGQYYPETEEAELYTKIVVNECWIRKPFFRGERAPPYCIYLG